MNRAAVLMIALCLTLACSGNGEPPEDPGLSELPQSGALNGMKIEESEDGPWTVRRTAGGSRSRGGDAGEKVGALREMTLDAEAGADGGMPPPAAKPMSPSPSPAESEAPEPVRGGAPLRAGKTDDNENFEDFLEFLAKWSDKESTAALVDMLDVAGRVWIKVVNAEGKPVPAARIKVTNLAADRVVWEATTYGDGRVPYYPNVAAEGLETTPVAAPDPAGDLVVEVRAGATSKRARWDGAADLTLTLETAPPLAEPIALDVLFLIDTTGSMSDEIERIKASLLGVTQKLRSLSREFDLRYAAVLYRDIGDEYVTKAHPFTGDIQAFDVALKSVRADGGGDGPESLNQGLAEAVGRADWRDGAAKVMFLIADAPPHMDYEGDVPYGDGVKAALARGIRIHSVAASGLDEFGTLAFRQIAQFTRGKFIFIQYGTIEETAAAHGVKGKVKSNNLDDILFEQIREEVARWAR